MHTEVKTRTRKTKAHGYELVLDILLLPRGSGNRSAARKLAAEFKSNARIAPHVRKVVAGASKITVHLIPSLELTKIIATWPSGTETIHDVPGQLALFT